MDDLLSDFLIETGENLSELDTALVKFEREPWDTASLSQIFRLVHTVKGTCGFLGLERLGHVAHAAENVLGRLRDGAMQPSAGTVNLILQALDRLKAILAALGASGAEPAGDDSDVIGALDTLVSGEVSPMPASAPSTLPSGPVAVEPAPEAGPQAVRVGVELLENLMTLAGELVLTRNQLLQIARGGGGTEFAAPLQRLSHITTELQEGVMKTRMQPIGNAWNGLPRLVRDLAHELGKKIELVTAGAETELDRQVLELIKDPLTHMVRNSAGHGLETPAERVTAGKPETGRITLSARHEGAYIIVEIGDDGRGLAVDKIRAKALSQGLATEAELAKLPEAELVRLIFQPGFSTANEITALSGRGVGLDVVRTNIEKIGGTVELRTARGEGTGFVFKIPLTLAIVSVLILEAGGERFAIPQLSVTELVRASTGGDEGIAVEHIDATPLLRLRDRLVPLVNLAPLMGLPQTGGMEGVILVVSLGGSLLGILVDRVFDTEEIVVKPVAPILRHVTMFSGNTILGDGGIVMILDPAGVARAAGVRETAQPVIKPKSLQRHADEIERVPLLIFRAGEGAPKAVPLALVARLETIERAQFEPSARHQVVQYRGRLMPLVAMPGVDQTVELQSTLVFAEGEWLMGLMVDEIVDVVEDRLDLELAGAVPGLLGSAVVAGQATDVLDTGFWLTQVWPDWFDKAAGGTARRRSRVLFVEDSHFFRRMMTPALAAVGFEITAVESASRALDLREAGLSFDAIVSDVEMPGMDGFDFARTLRAQGAWRDVPLVALSGLISGQVADEAREAGFTDYVAKSDRDALVATLRRLLVPAGAA